MRRPEPTAANANRARRRPHVGAATAVTAPDARGAAPICTHALGVGPAEAIRETTRSGESSLRSSLLGAPRQKGSLRQQFSQHWQILGRGRDSGDDSIKCSTPPIPRLPLSLADCVPDHKFAPQAPPSDFAASRRTRFRSPPDLLCMHPLRIRIPSYPYQFFPSHPRKAVRSLHSAAALFSVADPERPNNPPLISESRGHATDQTRLHCISYLSVSDVTTQRNRAQSSTARQPHRSGPVDLSR
jgi:hypothetical protein